MDTTLQPQSVIETPKSTLALKVFGVGTAGISVLERLLGNGLPASSAVAVSTDTCPLAASSAAEKLHLETKPLRGLGTGGDPERGRALAEEHLAQLKSLCEATDLVFVVAGLGGGAGTGISPVLARAAKETGALVLAFATLPFDCEGSRRQDQALDGLAELQAAADGVVCLPNQKVFKLIDENTSVLDTFKLTNHLLADAARGLWRLLTHTGLLEIHFSDLCALLRDQHTESAFAAAEALGPTRSREVVDQLLAHPLLDGGRLLDRSDGVLVSLMGGPDLTMAEINRVMEQINSRCKQAQVLVGAAIDETFRDQLAVTLIAVRKAPGRPEPAAPRHAAAEDLDTQLLTRTSTTRPGSRFVPPPPVLPPEKMAQMLTRQAAANPRARKALPKLRQGQLPLDIISKGRFDKSEPTIHKGEDLDVPTYIRRGVALN